MEKMEKAVSVIPGLGFEMTQPIQMRSNELMTGIKQDVAIKIYGNDLNILTSSANKVASLIKNVDGVSDPFVEKVNGLPQIQVVYNRDQSAKYGISIKDANTVLKTALAGSEAGFVYEGSNRFDLVLRMDKDLRNDVNSIRNLYLPINSGGNIPFSQIADIDYKDAPRANQP